MNGAESIVKSLTAAGIDRCFANPGTSEMHFLAALDRVGGIDCSLCLFEGVVTGAADGYARMAGKPALTLLHCGPGLANGLANLHNAKRARTPMLNIVGDHARDHVRFNTPLTSDVVDIARPFSDWVRKIDRPEDIARDVSEAIAASSGPKGGIATLILPTDLAWGPGPTPLSSAPQVPGLDPVADEVIAEAAAIIERGEPVLIFATGPALSEAGTRALGRLASLAHVEYLAPVNGPRYDRGAGRVDIARIPYDPGLARARIGHIKHILLVGTDEPASFFAYPDTPGSVVPEGCTLHRFSEAGMDAVAGLEALADRLGTGATAFRVTERIETARPSGAITPTSLAAAIAATLPEHAIICDEGLTQGREVMPATTNGPPHSWVQITGGAIGNGLPLALGAAMGARDRRVVSVQADGSGLFTLQALWSQAREGLDVTTVILANQSYEILKGEMANIGVPTPGPLAQDMMSLQNPAIDWLALSKGFGVPAARADDAETLMQLLEQSYATPGPFLIEARIG